MTVAPESPASAGTADHSLRGLADQAGRSLEQASAEDVIRWAVRTFGPRLAVTSSMADAVIVDLVSRVGKEEGVRVDVLFLDTGYHFVETIGTRDAVEVIYPQVRVRTLLPLLTVAAQDQQFGPRLHERDPDLCCAMRKVEPLKRALADYDAWITGLRRDESPTRAATPVVGYDEGRGKVKINPIARWTQDDVDTYIAANGVLQNPLLMDGYSSIGCAPCTRRSESGREGRWAGLGKTECGIHL
ncbi:MAG TPA: phosphoadenylyl-sulfate reductase [Propionibacteriaceae bacterium]|nr:phosphoadenylyl-sulfate reductase [Propionibacteriaceae bacterium]